VLGASAACSTELPGQWTLSVENPDHVVVTTLKVKFTDKAAKSCRGGDWKIVKIVSATTRDKDFFPMSGPLSYTVVNNRLTIGRNELCDAYVGLQGTVEETSISGDYYSTGLLGVSTLGYFTLSQTK
jgi:hypothetical protein